MSPSSSTTGNTMGKLARLLAAGSCLLGLGAALLGMGTAMNTSKTRTYAAEDSAFPNAQIGYAPMTDDPEAGDATLRYLELRWREVEPEEGVYAWEAIEQKYGLAALREQGIHLVLRFVCDVPGKEPHLDIPDWQTSDLPPLHKFHKKTFVCIRRILRALGRCAAKSSDVPNVYRIRGDIL